jgi:type II secretory pathway pseudopilin PulG
MNVTRRLARRTGRALQKGFTLIELAIVGLFLGLLAVFAVTQFTGAATNETRANSIIEASQKITDNWSLVAQACGLASAMNAATTMGADLTLGNAVNSGTAGATGTNNLRWLVGAGGTLHTSYQACVGSTGIRQMAGLAVLDGATLRMNGYAMDVAAGTTGTVLALSFGNVPAAVSDLVVRRLGGSAVVSGTTVTVTRPL